jgi:hypothetical protein
VRVGIEHPEDLAGRRKRWTKDQRQLAGQERASREGVEGEKVDETHAKCDGTEWNGIHVESRLYPVSAKQETDGRGQEEEPKRGTFERHRVANRPPAP